MRRNAVRRVQVKLAFAVTSLIVLGVAAVAVANDGSNIRERLSGFEEVPALSTSGAGEFRASIRRSSEEIQYQLSFGELESEVTQAHIHFENRSNNGPIVVFLCTNLGNGPAGTQTCPATGGTITGTIRPADIGAGAAAAGLGAGEFAEFARAVRAGSTYVNVHTTVRPGGEIRAQLSDDSKDDHSHDD
jgi:hypothetical protein